MEDRRTSFVVDKLNLLSPLAVLMRAVPS